MFSGCSIAMKEAYAHMEKAGFFSTHGIFYFFRGGRVALLWSNDELEKDDGKCVWRTALVRKQINLTYNASKIRADSAS